MQKKPVLQKKHLRLKTEITLRRDNSPVERGAILWKKENVSSFFGEIF
jgi:hypothetical protein